MKCAFPPSIAIRSPWPDRDSQSPISGSGHESSSQCMRRCSIIPFSRMHTRHCYGNLTNWYYGNGWKRNSHCRRSCWIIIYIFVNLSSSYFSSCLLRFWRIYLWRRLTSSICLNFCSSPSPRLKQASTLIVIICVSYVLLRSFYFSNSSSSFFSLLILIDVRFVISNGKHK